MPPSEVESTTDTPEQVTATMGGLNKDSEESETQETKSETPEKEDVETKNEESEASTSSDELEANDDDESSEDEDQEDELEESEEKESEQNKKGKGRAQKRIKKLTKKFADAARERDYWREMAMKSQSQTQKDDQGQNEKTESKETSDRPNPDDFETHADYVDALTDWKLEKKLSEREQKQKQSQIQSEQQKLVRSYQEKVESFKKEHTDFDQVMESVDDVVLSPTVQETILTHENGPELAYELIKQDPDEFERINQLPPIQAARALGKFEATLQKSSDSKTKTKRTTSAPPPVNPTGGRSTRATKKSLHEVTDYKEYERMRLKQRGLA